MTRVVLDRLTNQLPTPASTRFRGRSQSFLTLPGLLNPWGVTTNILVWLSFLVASRFVTEWSKTGTLPTFTLAVTSRNFIRHSNYLLGYDNHSQLSNHFSWAHTGKLVDSLNR